MAVKPYNQDDEDSPYAKAGAGSESTAVDPNDPPASSSEPKPYVPPPTVAAPSDSSSDAPPVRTFAQMESEGQARPPAPKFDTSQLPGITDAGGQIGSPVTSPITPYVPTEKPITMDGDAGGPVQPDAPPPTLANIGTAQLPPPSDIHGMTVPTGQSGEGPQPIHTLPAAGLDTPAPASSDGILSLLTGHASGTDNSPLQDATTQATLDQLKNPSPYNSDEVKREYGDLGAGIDAEYDSRQRGLDNQFAQRGLFGSVGKDFASGRAADTEVGRRTAKTQLASDLAKAQATSQGQYQANAINQGQSGTNAGNANQLNWLHSLMGYGNDAFSHDLQTAQFQQGQNENEQDYLLRLLEAGYGA